MTVMCNKFIGTVAYLGGVPSVLEEFCWSWSQMVQYNTEYLCQPGELIFYDRARASYHAFARNTLASRMRGDWIVMLDTDHLFEVRQYEMVQRVLTEVSVGRIL